MRRREFVNLLGGAVALAPLAAWAQEFKRTYRIGVITRSPRMAINYVAFFDELQRLGFVEGQNLIVDARGFAARSEQFPELALALVDSHVDALVCGGDLAIRAAQQVTQIIPIVGVTDDMLSAGLVHSLAKPGGNTTGISILATELDGKRLEILSELVPHARRIAALADYNVTRPGQLTGLENAARERGVQLSVQRIVKAEEITGAIDQVRASGAEALNILASPLLNAQRRFVIERVAALRLPAIYQWPETAKEGGLVAYGPSFARMGRQNAQQLAKVLAGIKPADLPVQQPTKFDLAINLKTARALGLTVSPTLLNRADEVIE
jgi:putative tryptophan/tyrosine transport system substrate-binding protein